MNAIEIGAEALDECWDKLVLGAIGETIDPGNEVTGVRVIHKVRFCFCAAIVHCEGELIAKLWLCVVRVFH